MDPDATLKFIRTIISSFHQYGDRIGDDQYDTMLEMLVEHVEELDAWLTNGGFMPEAWNRAKNL